MGAFIRQCTCIRQWKWLTWGSPTLNCFLFQILNSCVTKDKTNGVYFPQLYKVFHTLSVSGPLRDRNVPELCNDVKMENDAWPWLGNTSRYV